MFWFLNRKTTRCKPPDKLPVRLKGPVCCWKIAWYWSCPSATHFSCSMSHPPVPRTLLCSWVLVYAQQKVGLNSFNLYFNSNVIVNPFCQLLLCNNFCSRAWVLAGGPSWGDELQGLCMQPQKGSFASCLLAALLYRSWNVVTNNICFNSPGAEEGQSAIMKSPWICSGEELPGSAGKNSCLRSSLLCSHPICRHTTEHARGLSLQQRLSCQQHVC